MDFTSTSLESSSLTSILLASAAEIRAGSILRTSSKVIAWPFTMIWRSFFRSWSGARLPSMMDVAFGMSVVCVVLALGTADEHPNAVPTMAALSAKPKDFVIFIEVFPPL
ncbi:hypothetical protein D3C87_1408690 [compost metagenome]